MGNDLTWILTNEMRKRESLYRRKLQKKYNVKNGK